MATSSVAPSAQPSTRELRGIALYKEHADTIRFEDGVWRIPGQNGAATTYRVTLGRHEHCGCLDHKYRSGNGQACVHVYAATIARAKSHPSDGCGQRYQHRHLTEVPGDHLTLFEGDLVCPECALAHGVI